MRPEASGVTCSGPRQSAAQSPVIIIIIIIIIDISILVSPPVLLAPLWPLALVISDTPAVDTDCTEPDLGILIM